MNSITALFLQTFARTSEIGSSGVYLEMISLTEVIVSHHEEDRLLNDFFYVTGIERGVFIDVGGNVPENAVSRPFVQKGWQGVVIEPIPENAKRFEENGWSDVICGAVTSHKNVAKGTGTLFLSGPGAYEHSSLSLANIDPRSGRHGLIEVSLTTLGSVCAYRNYRHIDLLHVDTEGTELDIMRGFPFDSVSVSLILVEDWQRSSALHRFLRSRGYKIIRRTGFNSWYVPDGRPVDLKFYYRFLLWKKIYISSHIKWLRHQVDLAIHKFRSRSNHV